MAADQAAFVTSWTAILISATMHLSPVVESGPRWHRRIRADRRAYLEDNLIPWLIGEDPLQIGKLWQKMYGAQGWDSHGNTPAEFAAILKSDFDKWAKVVKAAGLRAD